ncbi:cysteine synthase 2, putative [Acanthamoeba castellanii str. Neff]|uniref:Cysteine synthase 2, putative n=1 Tax=Acanthamoeba castellanii (strain ATCC 30010 / Neff) TaxID=1257118 RepID=L8H9F9_ACACF|nr:cysteine synthase 2, putative [Acanthamoeba castellanii str. Neff]ELR21373.1 cysteine synthase 2, putative [Acanthamoeba castellanii str. Neff]
MLPLWVHSTGIALALLGRARGYEVELYLPDNVSTEKVDLLTTLGAKIKIVPIMPMSQPEHFMHYAMSCALADPDAYYCNQPFADVSISSGREKNPAVVSYLVDPPGSGLYHLVTKGVMFHPQDTMTVEPLSARSFYEGVGVNRQTENFTQVERYDGAFQGSEQEGVAMAHHLLRHDGLFVGGSSALNCRYNSRIYNTTWLEERGLSVPHGDDLSFLEEDGTPSQEENQTQA